MDKLSTDELLTLLTVLSKQYVQTDVVFNEGSISSICDGFNANILRLIKRCSTELVLRIELPL